MGGGAVRWVRCTICCDAPKGFQAVVDLMLTALGQTVRASIKQSRNALASNSVMKF